MRAAGTVEALREVKDAGEIALLRLACEAADAALQDLVERGGLRPGRTEKEVGRELESLMLDHGADGVSFETIVAAGAELGDPAPSADRCGAGRRGLRQDRLRRPGVRLPLRHDPHVRAVAGRSVAARHL